MAIKCRSPVLVILNFGSTEKDEYFIEKHMRKFDLTYYRLQIEQITMKIKGGNEKSVFKQSLIYNTSDLIS